MIDLAQSRPLRLRTSALLLAGLLAGCTSRPRHYDTTEAGSTAAKSDEARLVELEF